MTVLVCMGAAEGALAALMSVRQALAATGPDGTLEIETTRLAAAGAPIWTISPSVVLVRFEIDPHTQEAPAAAGCAAPAIIHAAPMRLTHRCMPAPCQVNACSESGTYTRFQRTTIAYIRLLRTVSGRE